MKIGICSELHLQEDLGNSKPDPLYGTSRLHEILNAVSITFAEFKKQEVEIIIHAGDMVHDKNSIPITVMKAFGSIIQNAPCPILDILSNHGASDRVGRHHVSQVFDSLKNTSARINNSYYIIGPDIPFIISPPDNVLIYGIPFHADNDIDNFYKDCDKVKEDYSKRPAKHIHRILVLHQGVKGAKLKNAPFEVGKNVSSKRLQAELPFIDLFIAGHYHDPQKLSDKFIIPGALCQHNFGDAGGKRGYWIYDTKTRDLKFHELKDVPKYWKITSEDNIEDIRHSDHVRIEVLSSTQIEKLKKKYSKFDASFVIKPKVINTEMRDSSMTLQVDDKELLEKYVKNKNPKDLDQEIILKLGRKIIGRGQEK